MVSIEVVGLVEDTRLPFQAQKDFISQYIAEREVIDNHFGSGMLIGIGWNEIIDNWDKVQGGGCYELIAKLLEIVAVHTP